MAAEYILIEKYASKAIATIKNAIDKTTSINGTSVTIILDGIVNGDENGKIDEKVVTVDFGDTNEKYPI